MVAIFDLRGLCNKQEVVQGQRHCFLALMQAASVPTIGLVLHYCLFSEVRFNLLRHKIPSEFIL